MNVVDSSGWIEFFTGGPAADFFAEPLAEVSGLVIPTVCLTEVFRFILREDSESTALHASAAMLRGRVVPLDAHLALQAATLGVEHRLPLADSIVYATARWTESTVWTMDSDFEELPGVRYRPK